MRRFILLFALPLLAATVPTPPTTKTEPVTDTVHGTKIIDAYRWLEDQNSPATRAWIKEQIQYTDSLLSKVPAREQIHRTLERYTKIDVAGMPAERGGRYFYSKRAAAQNQGVIYMRAGRDGAETILVDPNKLSADQTISASIGGLSEDGKLMMYDLRQGGEDETSMTLLDIESAKPLADKFPRARYSSVSFQHDNRGLFYSKYTSAGMRVYSHRIGTDPAADPMIFGDGYGPSQGIGCDVSSDGKWLLCQVLNGSANTKTELYVKDLASDGPFVPIVKDIEASFSGDIADGRLYVLTTWNAPNGRILAIDLKHPARENWKEIVLEGKSRVETFTLVGGKLVVETLVNVASNLQVLNLDGKLLREVSLPSIGTASALSGRWESDETFYSFSSFAQAPTIYRYSVATGKQEVYWQAKIPLDPATVEVKQVWFESKDKTKVPMFLAYKKGTQLDRKRPVILTGYGGFDLSELPRFSPYAAAWIDMGGVYALANLRGGGEFGKAWHEAGMFEHKQNVFDDFIGAGEYLIEQGYTQPSKLAIQGGSNGGLLVGAALTQRPELFGAVICGAPLLDMVRYHMFKVAKFWVPEYGSSDDPKQFEYIYRYSPYHHVKAGVKYPAVMFVTGDADTRVDPLHARKMAALLQAANASEKPILLHYDTKAGHSGGLPVNRLVDNMTDEMAFLFWQLSVE